ncbi:hypothetical protein [Sorangium sp. So ce1335]|uniref:hypothetical protein n=1 Tax=Sorangium sp. So ce1335 TaxID=3133335 RepID=UPI003F631E50
MSCGYRRDAISLVMSHAARGQRVEGGTGSSAAAGAGIDGAAFGAVGAGAVGAGAGAVGAGAGAVGAGAGAVGTAAASAALGATVTFPRLGIVAAGPMEAALAGADGAAGGLVGALVAAGVPEHRARVHEAGLQQGEILVGVHAQSHRDAEILEMILEYAGAENVRSDSARRRPYDSFI